MIKQKLVPSTLLLLLVAVLFLSGCDGKLDVNSYPLQQPDTEYELDTWGENSEVYEFTPKRRQDLTCIVYILDNMKAMDMECFKKPQGN